MEDYYEFAKDVLLDIKAIARCDAHEDYFSITFLFDDNSVYSVATAKAKEKRDDINWKAFHEAISRVLDDAVAGDCPYCDKAMNE